MALFDVDKLGNDRGSPMPNVHDVLSAGAMMAKATGGMQYSVNAPPAGRINVTNQRILTNDGVTNRLLITPTQVSLSQPGVDVTQAAVSQMIWTSLFDGFKIVGSGTHTTSYSFNSSSGSGSVNDNAQDTIVHGLGFIPAVLVFVQFPSFGSIPQSQAPIGNGSVAGFTFGGGTGFAFAMSYYTVNVDANNLYLGFARWTNLGNGAFSATMVAAAGSWTFKYYLLQETAN